MTGLTAIDLFAGAGGATQGLRDAGYSVVAAVENDRDAAATWRLNHPATMVEEDIRHVSPTRLLSETGLRPGQLHLLKACPPCQGYSSLRGSAAPDIERNDLVLDLLRFVRAFKPRAVLLENVPGLRGDARLEDLTGRVQGLGYQTRHYLVEASSLGVPQRRRRLVVVAIRGTAESTPLPADWAQFLPQAHRRPAMTAGEALKLLETSNTKGDPWHRWRRNSDLVARRIQAIPIGGSRFDLPVDLQLACHQRLSAPGRRQSRVATGTYGRIHLNRPAPTMTTRCTTPSCGSFIHPTENRGLSLREAATLQTFPTNYQWSGGYDSVERQIGNAVPVWMAGALGRAVADVLAEQRPASH